MMLNTGADITLLTKKWVDAHGLAVKEKVPSISQAPMALGLR